MEFYAKYFFVFLVRLTFVHATEILAFFPIGGTSHYNVPEIILKSLATRGHNVTVVSAFPQKTPVPNLHHIDISSQRPVKVNALPFKLVQTVLQSTDKNFHYIVNISRSSCEDAFSMPKVQNLLKEDRKFDLVITELFGADCGVGFAWKFKAPLVSILATRRTPWGLNRVGNPLDPSYLHVTHSAFPERMNFFQRLINTYWNVYFSIFYEYSHNGFVTNEISRKFFGEDVPPVNDIVYNTSLVLANTHYTIDQPHALVPNYIEIAGVHVKEPKPLPSNIQKLMDEAKDGVIYFTLGSLIRVSSMPKETIQAFRDAFAELPQKVLWKFELELEDIPPNVIISKWFPQTDIFHHPNMRVFISHGGNSGSIEAVHFGIPMVGIPLYFDQNRNIRSFVDKGVAVMLDMNELTKENILSAIRTITNEKGYAERMKKLSKIFHDRPMSALDTAVYWIEYVIRHKGAHHLRTAGTTMPWYQYFLLDVIAFLVIVTLTAFLMLQIIFKFLFKSIKYVFSSEKIKIN